MNAIPAIPSVDQAAKLIKTAESLQAPGPSSPDLKQKFQALMQRTDQSTHVAAEGPNAAGQMLQVGQSDMDKMEARMDDLVQDLPNMDVSEVAAASAALTHDAAIMNFKVQAATTLTENSHKSLDSLLKNQ